MRCYRMARGFWGLGIQHMASRHWCITIGPWCFTSEPG